MKLLNDPTIRFPVHAEGDARQTLSWALRLFGERIVLASSLGPQSLVILDLCDRLRLDLRVVFLDTGLHFEETLDFVTRVEARFGISIERVRPQLSLDEQAERHGAELWTRHPDRCCALRKVDPLRSVLKEQDAWVTGLRRTPDSSRQAVGTVEWDAQYDLFKINPLARWSKSEVDAYVEQYAIPVHPLRAAGYASIGCEPCTRPANGVDERAGRWAGFAKTECGLHLGTLNADAEGGEAR